MLGGWLRGVKHGVRTLAEIGTDDQSPLQKLSERLAELQTLETCTTSQSVPVATASGGTVSLTALIFRQQALNHHRQSVAPSRHSMEFIRMVLARALHATETCLLESIDVEPQDLERAAGSSPADLVAGARSVGQAAEFSCWACWPTGQSSRSCNP